MSSNFKTYENPSIFHRWAAAQWRRPKDPTIYGATEIDMEPALAFLEKVRQKWGVQVTVTLGGITRTAVANDLQQWSVEFPAMQASVKPITLTVISSHGHRRTVNNILVGDVWYLTGSTMLNGEMAYTPRDTDAKPLVAMPLAGRLSRP